MSGFVLLDKNSGFTSRFVASNLAKLFGYKTFGYLGTLDPLASGLLIIAFEEATKMIPYIELVNSNYKEYLFSIIWGFETDTLDITGKVVDKSDLKIFPNLLSLKEVCECFIGEYLQEVPKFSAVHISGKRSYELARKGFSFEAKSKIVKIKSIDIVEHRENRSVFKVVCSNGTYVRSLARDISRKFNTFATVDMIRRLKSNGFDIEKSHRLDFYEKIFNNSGDLSEYLYPLDFGLGDIPVLNLNLEDSLIFKNGGFLEGLDFPDSLFRVYTGDHFVGIGSITSGVLKPKRVLKT